MQENKEIPQNWLSDGLVKIENLFARSQNKPFILHIEQVKSLFDGEQHIDYWWEIRNFLGLCGIGMIKFTKADLCGFIRSCDIMLWDRQHFENSETKQTFPWA